jgi:Na+:H+ antiporter, NhaA family
VNVRSAARRNAQARFIDHESAAGLLLLLAAALALMASNTPGLAHLYDHLLALKLSVELGTLGLSKPLLLWINEGLMAIFFFHVGLELKREALEGHLSSYDQATLPGLAAAGGMAAPAAIYYLVIGGEHELARGWAIPAATDIAFALGAVSLLGKRVPPSLKVFLLTLATLDDFGAIAIIAMFYTADLSVLAIGLAAIALAILLAFNRLGLERVTPYVIVGICLWVFVLKSGIHATLAGVALAMAIPNRSMDGRAIIARLESALQPWVRFVIMPVFAFANAGLSLSGLSPTSIVAPLPLAIALGLTIGKPLGIISAVALAVVGNIAKLPKGASWASMLGIACLAGIGFTMSLFIGTMAFTESSYSTQVRLGVLCGSLISAASGYFILRYTRSFSQMESVIKRE